MPKHQGHKQGITTLADETVSPESTFTVSPLISDDEGRAGDDQTAGTQTAQADPHPGLGIQTAQPEPHYGLGIQTAQPNPHHVGHDAAAMRPETQAAGLARCNATMGRGRGPTGPGRQPARPRGSDRIPPTSDPPSSISRQCPDTNPRDRRMAAAVPVYTKPSYVTPDPRQVVENYQQAPNINSPGPRRETRHAVNSHPHSHCYDPTPTHKMQVLRNWQAQNPPASRTETAKRPAPQPRQPPAHHHAVRNGQGRNTNPQAPRGDPPHLQEPWPRRVERDQKVKQAPVMWEREPARPPQPPVMLNQGASPAQKRQRWWSGWCFG